VTFDFPDVLARLRGYFRANAERMALLPWDVPTGSRA
jgi:hypothetical protein